jgi:hypothetical protein
MNTPERITQAELARRLKVTRGAVTKAAKSGRITAGPDGLFDPEEAERQWRANTRQNMKSVSPAAKSKATGYAEARAKKERHAANILEMREAELAGRTIKTELALEMMGNISWAWRGFLDHLPIHLAKAAYGKLDLGEMETAIEREIDTRLENLAEMMDRVTYQGKALELPPSPLEKEILERVEKDMRERVARKITEEEIHRFMANTWDQLAGVLQKRNGFRLPTYGALMLMVEDEGEAGPLQACVNTDSPGDG